MTAWLNHHAAVNSSSLCALDALSLSMQQQHLNAEIIYHATGTYTYLFIPSIKQPCANLFSTTTYNTLYKVASSGAESLASNIPEDIDTDQTDVSMTHSLKVFNEQFGIRYPTYKPQRVSWQFSSIFDGCYYHQRFLSPH